MRFEVVGQEKEKVTITISPLDLAKSDIFEMLSLLLEKIKTENKEILHLFIDIVSKSLEKMMKNEHFTSENSRLREEISTYKQLEDYYDFVRKHLNFFIETLDINEDLLWKNERISFDDKNFMESVFCQFYTHLASLIELLGKENAIDFYKEHVDNFNYTINARNQKNIYKDLSDLREKQIKWLQNNPYGRVRIFSDVRDGKLIRICKNCEKLNALKDSGLKDKQILYAIMCYMHIPLAKVWNKNIILTLDSRVVDESPYCVYVYHDTRITKEIIHPSKKFLDEMWLKYK